MTKKKSPVVIPDRPDLKVGVRVEIHPATDEWMRGARYGEVRRILPSAKDNSDPATAFIVSIKLDAIVKLKHYYPDYILPPPGAHLV